jgi:hypothetical protein
VIVEKKGLFQRLPHRPLHTKTRIKKLDGIYRSIESGHIHIVKNVYLRSVIPEGMDEPVMEYTCSLRSTDPEIGTFRRISLINVPWEFLLKL